MVGVRREIVETVHEMEGLRIGIHLAYLLHATMDIAEIQVDFLYDLTVDCCAETKHTMSRRMLRADIDHKIISLEYTSFLFHNLAFTFHPCIGKVGLTFVLYGYGIDIRIIVIILAQRIPLPVNIKEETTHIRIVDEYYAEIVIYLTFIYGSDIPDIEHRMNERLLTIAGSHHFDRYTLVT